MYFFFLDTLVYSLKGAKGDPGTKGDAGPTGQKGENLLYLFKFLITGFKSVIY